jgi:hypothetical protein
MFLGFLKLMGLKYDITINKKAEYSEKGIQ